MLLDPEAPRRVAFPAAGPARPPARVAQRFLPGAPDEIARAIAAQDKGTLSRPAGVGPKLAARLATELKDKAAAFGIAPAPASESNAGAPAAAAGSINEDAISALVNLGYKRVEAFGAVARVTRRLGAEARLDAVIRAGLQELRLVTGTRAEEDAAELALRPQTLDDFIGQKQVRENLKIFITAAK
eukprot:gene12426-15820_t